MLDNAPTTPAAVGGVASIIASGYAAPSGSNRKVIAVVHCVSSSRISGERTVTWGGRVMREVVTRGEGGANFGFETIGIYELSEASFPSTETGDVVATLDIGTATQTISVFTIGNVDQGGVNVFEDSRNSLSDDITPTRLGSLVIGAAASSNNYPNANWISGLNRWSVQGTGTSTSLLGTNQDRPTAP